MDDKHDIEHDSYEDEEYQFSDEEQASDATYDESYGEDEEADVATGGLSSKFPFLKVLDRFKHKRLILVAGGIILIIVIYNLLGGNRGTSPDKTIDQVQFTPGTEKMVKPTLTPTEQLATQLKTAEAAKAKAPQKPKVPFDDIDKSTFAPAKTGLPAAEQQDAVSTTELKQVMASTMQTIQTQNQQLIKNLASNYDSKIQSLEKMSELNGQYINMLRQETNELREQIKTLTQTVANNTKNQQRLLFNQGISFDASGAPVTEMSMDTGTSPAQQRVMVRKPIYVLQAVVPGRAWLKSDTGETITVSKGDTIPNMGIVVEIDAVNGIVTLNSGKIITSQ